MNGFDRDQFDPSKVNLRLGPALSRPVFRVAAAMHIRAQARAARGRLASTSLGKSDYRPTGCSVQNPVAQTFGKAMKVTPDALLDCPMALATVRSTSIHRLHEIAKLRVRTPTEQGGARPGGYQWIVESMAVMRGV